MARQLPGAVTVRWVPILPLPVVCGSMGAASKMNQTELIASALVKGFIGMRITNEDVKKSDLVVG